MVAVLRRICEGVDAFQDGEGDFFLISLKADGTGLNLMAADMLDGTGISQPL